WEVIQNGNGHVSITTDTQGQIKVLPPRTAEEIVARERERKVIRSGYHQKDRKPSQNDKTEHGMEKTVQNQGQSPKMSKSESILKNQQSNRSQN
ncbi:hypothetical protein Tco_0403135, partial [Tanacetum coccineum]